MGDLIGSLNSTSEDEKMSDGINTDKVIVNAGSGGGGDGGNMAAVIAALGNRNQGNDNAALIAALGNRNDDSNSLAPLMAMAGGGFGGGGMNALWPIILLALLGRRGGLGGGDDCGNGDVERPVFNAAVLGKLGSIEGSIPSTALQTQNALQGALAQLALGTAQGFERTGDRIQNATYLLTKELCDVNQNVSSQGCQTREVVQDTGKEIMNLINGNRIAELEAQIARLHSHDHNRESEVRVTQVMNNNQQQAQAQAQLQGQFDQLFRRLGNIELEQNQISRATNANLIFGNTGATTTGAQTNTPTNVRA